MINKADNSAIGAELTSCANCDKNQLYSFSALCLEECTRLLESEHQFGSEDESEASSEAKVQAKRSDDQK